MRQTGKTEQSGKSGTRLTQVSSLRGHSGEVLSVAFSPDGRTLASGGADGTTRLWELPRGGQIGWSPAHKEWVSCLAFSPDGKWLLSGSRDRTVRLQTMASAGTNPRISAISLPAHPGGIYCVAFSPDGDSFASGSLGAVKVWDTRAVVAGAARPDQLRPHRTLPSDRRVVFGLAFLDRRTLALGTAGDRVQAWDAATGRLLWSVRAQGEYVAAIAASPRRSGTNRPGLVASGGADGALRLWEAGTGKGWGHLPVGGGSDKGAGGEPGVTSLAFSPDGTRLAVSRWNGDVELLGVAQPAPKRLARVTASGPTGPGAVYCVRFSPDGRLLASACGDGLIRLWRVG